MKIQGINNFGMLQQSTTRDVKSLSFPSFGIYKGSKPRAYGEYRWGFYKGYKIEVYDAYNYKQKLIYVSDKLKNFVKSKLFYIENGVKKVTKAEGRRRYGQE